MTSWTQPGSSADQLGSHVGRLAFRPSTDIDVLHTSLPAAWQGAVMTHVRTRPGFQFSGTWSWLRLSAKRFPGGARFPGCGASGQDAVSARLQLGLPGVSYNGSWDVPTESISLFIDPALAERVAHAPFEEASVCSVAETLHRDSVIEHLMSALLADIQAGSLDGPCLGETIVAAILGRLRAIKPQPVPSRGSRLTPAEVRRLQDFVLRHLGRPVHLDDLAGELRISPRHLSRTMSATLGVTPHRFLLNCRIEHARNLLMTSRLSCDEIAERAGFADHSHMSATFRRLLDTTPLQIRHSLG